MGNRLFKLMFVAFFAGVTCACERFAEPNSEARPRWAHLSGPDLMGSVFGQIEVAKNKIPSNRAQIKVCLASERDDFSQDDFVFESKLAFAAWFVAAGFGSTEWALLDFQVGKTCPIEDASVGSVLNLPHVESPMGSHAKLYSPVTMWCAYMTETTLQCQSDFLMLGFGSVAPLQLLRSAETSRWRHIEYTGSARSTLSPYIRWMPLRESIVTNAHIDKKVKLGLLGRIDGLARRETFEKYAELAVLLEKYNLKDESPQDFSKTRAHILSNRKQLVGVRVPMLPRVAAFHVILHELGHQFGMDHADAPIAQSTTGSATGGESVEIVIEKNSTMAYGEPLFFLTADDKAGARHVITAIQQILKEFDLAQ